MFAGNAVRHMLTGKAIPRAVRGHMLVDAALNTILVAKAYHIPLPNKETDEPKLDTARTDPENDDDETDQQRQVTVDVTSDITEAKDLYFMAMLSTLSVEDVCSAGVLVSIKGKLDDLNQTMTTRTKMLWLQYLDTVSIPQRLIKRHLHTVHDMLPYFAASGQSLYAKSAYLYLQIMLSLPETHPDAHRKFMEGYHVVRRSDRFWAGLSSDLIIEQVLMISIKTHGGLTRGKGMTEDQRWCGSCPCLYVQASMIPCRSVAVSHMKSVTSTRIYQQLDKREMSVTPLISSTISMREICSSRLTHCLTLAIAWQVKKESMLRKQERSE